MIRSSTFLLLSVVFSPFGSAQAQCTIDIPGGAVPVTTLQGTTLANGQFIWVCDAGLAAVTGNGNTVFVEDQGVGSVIGDNNILITKAQGAYVSGNNNEVFILDPADVADLGTNTTITACASVVFTYANAPNNGCVNVGLAETATSTSIALFPDPVGDLLSVVAEGVRIQRIRMFDARGRITLDRSGTASLQIPVAHLSAGLFVVMIDTDQGPIVRQMVKE